MSQDRISFGSTNPLQKLMEKGVTIKSNPFLPPRTMTVSVDLYEELVKMGKRVQTVEGEVVAEAQKQLEAKDAETTQD